MNYQRMLDRLTPSRLPLGGPETLRENMLEVLEESVAVAFQKRERLTLPEWMEKHFPLPREAAERGRRKFSRTPYLRGVAAALESREPGERVCIVKKGAQLGFSDLGCGLVGHRICMDPSTIMLICENESKANALLRMRVIPMLKGKAFEAIIPPSKLRLSGVEFPGGSLITLGSNSPSSFSSTSSPLLILDEFSRYPPSVGKEGDPLGLAMSRITTFGARGKIYIPSTPTDADEHEGSFETLYQSGDQRKYYMPCPHCEDKTTFDYKRFHIQKDGSAVIICESCGEGIEEKHKHAMMAAGEWIATKERSVPYITSFHCPGTLSPIGWLSWRDIAARLTAARAGKTALQPVMNTCFGDVHQEEIVVPEETDLTRHCYERERGIIPKEAAFVTLGVDVQRGKAGKGWLSWSLWAFGTSQRRWLVDVGEIREGDISSQDGQFALKKLINRTWQNENGVRKAPAITTVDSGDGELTKAVYAFCSHYPQPEPRPGGRWAVPARCVVPVKGSSKDAPDYIMYTPLLKQNALMARRIPLFVVGVTAMKRQLFSALKFDREDFESERHGAINLPSTIPAKTLKELISEVPVAQREKKDGGGYVLKFKPSGRNELLDTHNYALAGAEIVGLPLMSDKFLAKLAEKDDEASQETPQTQEGRTRRYQKRRRKHPRSTPI